MSKTKKNNINEITLNSIENLKLFHKTLLDEINLVIERSLLTQEKYVLIGSKFKDFAYIIADYYGINFPSLHNILIFLGNKFEIPQNLHIEIIKLSKNISIIKNNKNITVNESQLLSATKLILVYINLIVNKIIQNDFSQQIDSTNNIENNSNNNYNNDSKNSLNNNSAPDTLNNINNLNKFYDFIGLIYISRKKQNIEIEDNNTQTKKEKTEYYLKFKSKSGEEIVIKYNHNWEKLYDYVYSNMKINALKLRYDINLNLYYTSEISLIILEPDLLFDATEIAETYIKSNFVYENYFLSKYKDFKTNQYLVLGNLVNFMLDELVNDIEVEFEDLLKKAFKTKILSYIAQLWKIPFISSKKLSIITLFF